MEGYEKGFAFRKALSKLVPSAIGQTSQDHPLSEKHTFEKYADWKKCFILRRLRTMYLVGLLVNPIFILLDFISHNKQFYGLLPYRGLIELILLTGFLILWLKNASSYLNILLPLLILGPNICFTHMVLILGDYNNTYYNALALIFLAAAAIVPMSWVAHLTAQVTTLLYYFLTIYGRAGPSTDPTTFFESFFFLVFVCVALQISLILHERLQRAEFHAVKSEKKVRDELKATNTKLLELDQIKSDFFANISHELRTPLTLILGTLRNILGEKLFAQRKVLVEIGLRNTSRLIHLINELLDLAKFDSGVTKPQKICIDFSELVRGIAANFQTSEGRRIHFRGLSQSVPLEGDPRQLKKVVSNLLSNAFKFSDAQEGQVWIKLTELTDCVLLEIEDNGIGIPSKHLERIFDRFTQVEDSATRKYQGTGIGLALVKEIVSLHGGSIRVESKLGVGSTFTITLPYGSVNLENLAPIENEKISGIPPYQEEAQDPTGLLSPIQDLPSDSSLVLIADDNADMRRYLQGILQHHYRLCLAKNGHDALEHAKKNHPDLILTDMMMPQMSGDELLKAVRNDPTLTSTPVIFLTARAGTEARVESLEAGADDYIQKPFDDNEVLARISNIIRTRFTERKLIELQKEKLSRFLPAHVGELVLSGGAEDFLHGHRTEITVLFIDLRGFTAFAESAEPEDVMGLLSEFQAELGKIITEYQGTLERFTGDGMMVFFNDPLPVPNHQEIGARCALTMHHRVKGLRKTWKERGFDLGVGIGMATGFATLGVIGFEERRDYTAIGSVTNLAARLCAEAQHDQILVPERFKNEVTGLFDIEPIEEMILKGFRNSINVFNILGLKN